MMTASATNPTALSRLLAGENITVSFNERAATASFNTRTRRLELPTFSKMSHHVRDMFVGHEVAHAIWTPRAAEGETTWVPWTDVVKILGDKLAKNCQAVRVALSIVNVVEDARIERLIQDKYPGLRRDFRRAYISLMDNKFFGFDPKTVDLKTFCLIDRLNIHFKAGSILQVPFTAEEETFVERMLAAKTWGEVIGISADLFEASRDQSKAEEEASEEHAPEDEESEEEASEEPAPEDEESEEDETEETDPSESEEADHAAGSDESEEEASDDAGGDESEEADSNDAGGDESEEADSNDDGSTAESSDDETEETNPSESEDLEDSEEALPELPSTVQSLQDNLEDATDASSHRSFESNYVAKQTFQVPMGHTPGLKHVISTRFIEEWNASLTASEAAWLDNTFKTWKAAYRPLLGQLSNKFNQYKAASAAKRTKVNKTGVIDTNRLTQYRWAEDIFKSFTTVEDAKNHGMIMIVDWSGSMSTQLGQVLNQVLLVSQFCRALSIPFEAYAFYNALSACTDRFETVSIPGFETEYFSGEAIESYAPKASNGDTLFGFYPLIDSRSPEGVHRASIRGILNMMIVRNSEETITKATEIENPLATILPSYQEAYANGFRNLLWGSIGYSQNNPFPKLASTPLEPALVLCRDMLHRMRAKYSVHNLSLSVITDGENNNPWLTGVSTFYSHTSGKIFQLEGDKNLVERSSDRLKMILEWLRAETGASLFRLDIQRLEGDGIRRYRPRGRSKYDAAPKPPKVRQEESKFSLRSMTFDKIKDMLPLQDQKQLRLGSVAGQIGSAISAILAAPADFAKHTVTAARQASSGTIMIPGLGGWDSFGLIMQGPRAETREYMNETKSLSKAKTLTRFLEMEQARRANRAILEEMVTIFARGFAK